LRGESSDKSAFGTRLGKRDFTYERIVREFLDYQTSREKPVTFREVMLGKCDKFEERNAIFELPTFELVDTLHLLAAKLGIKNFLETFAGCGALGKAIMNYDGTHTRFEKIVVTDGDYDYETNGYKFTSVERYCIFENYMGTTVSAGNITEKEIIEDTMMVMGWVDHNFTHIIPKILSKHNLKCLVVLDYGDHISSSIPEGYKFLQLSLKQLCFRDNEYNYLASEPTSHSKVNIFYRNDATITAENLNATQRDNGLKPFVLSVKTVAHDMESDKLFPKSFTDKMAFDEDYGMSMLKKLSKLKIYSFPKFLVTIEELEKYVELCEHVTIKIPIEDHDKFVSMITMIERYSSCTSDEYKKAQKDGIIPTWVPRSRLKGYAIDEHSSGIVKDSIHRMYSRIA
jgi:hypothetical protein